MSVSTPSTGRVAAGLVLPAMEDPNSGQKRRNLPDN